MLAILLIAFASAASFTPTDSSCFIASQYYGAKTTTPKSDLAQLRSSSFNPVSYAKSIITCGVSNQLQGAQLILGDLLSTQNQTMTPIGRTTYCTTWSVTQLNYFQTITIGYTTFGLTYIQAVTDTGVTYQRGVLGVSDFVATQIFNSTADLIGLYGYESSGVMVGIGFYYYGCYIQAQVENNVTPQTSPVAPNQTVNSTTPAQTNTTQANQTQANTTQTNTTQTNSTQANSTQANQSNTTQSNTTQTITTAIATSVVVASTIAATTIGIVVAIIGAILLLAIALGLYLLYRRRQRVEKYSKQDQDSMNVTRKTQPKEDFVFEMNEEMKAKQQAERILLRGKSQVEKLKLLNDLQQQRQRELQMEVMMERQQLRHDEITATRRINEEQRYEDLFRKLKTYDAVEETKTRGLEFQHSTTTDIQPAEMEHITPQPQDKSLDNN